MRKSVIFLTFVILTLSLSLISLPSYPAFANEPNYKFYIVKDFNFEINLPDTTAISEDYFDSNEIRFSAFLNDQAIGFWGYIQFWNIPDLEEFLINSKYNSPFSFYYYDLIPFQLKAYEGFKTNWSVKMTNGQEISAEEYYFVQGEKVCAISFLSEGKSIAKELEKIITFSISSIKWNSD